MLARVCDPAKRFQAENYEILKSSEWGLEKSELPRERNFYSRWCVSCRIISLPIFNCLHCKLAKIALFLYLRQYWAEYMASSLSSFAYFTHFSDLNISWTNGKRGKRRLYSFIDFYLIHLKYQGVKIWSQYFKLVLWSTFSRILLQRIKHFWSKLAEKSFFIISDQNLAEFMTSLG